MSLIRWSQFAGAVSLAVAGACAEPNAPVAGRLDATYVATSVGSRQLPVSDSNGSSTTTLLSDRLDFSVDGTVRRTTVFRRVMQTGSPRDTVYALDETWTYTVSGGTVTIAPPPCPPNALCIGPMTGSIDTHRVRLPFSVLGTATVTFSRQADV
jgi:hypothetical protein